MYKSIFLFSAVFLAGCGNSNEAPEEPGGDINENNTEVDEGDPLGAMEAHFEGEGFEIGEREVKDYESIGAEEGFAVELDNSEIELYLFEENSPEAEEIEDSGLLEVDDETMEAEINGEIVITGHTNHPDEEEIISVFHNY